MATVDYYVNPTQPWVPEEEAVGAIRAAFATWAEWNPTLRFDYLGTTTRPPIPGDHMNVVGWLPFYAAAAASVSPEGWPSVTGGQNMAFIGEADIIINVLDQSYWDRCEQADDSCQPRQVRDPVTRNGLFDIQGLVTHEVGHFIGLQHVYGPDAVTLTMTGDPPVNTYRRWSTLGLGDVLGAKFLYPWTCPPAGAPIPPSHSRVCPTITIFSP